MQRPPTPAPLERPVIETPDLICYRTEESPPELIPARPERDWMELTDQRYAYRCIPLSIANASGWEVVLPSPSRRPGPAAISLPTSASGRSAILRRSHAGSSPISATAS